MYNRSSSESNVLSVKKSGSLKRTNKTRTADTTDGAAGGVWSDISSVFHRGAQSLRIPVKRRGMAHKDSHWDSGSSVSSVSENSEGQTTERELEQNLSPTSYEPTAFTIGSVETTIYDTLTNGSVPSPVIVRKAATDGTPPSSLTTDDSDPLSGSWTVIPSSFGKNIFNSILIPELIFRIAKVPSFEMFDWSGNSFLSLFQVRTGPCLVWGRRREKRLILRSTPVA